MNAEAIFLKNKIEGKNIFAGFRKNFTISDMEKSVELHITARSFYRVYINGEFVCHGPARAAHNHLWMDQIAITDYICEGENALAIEVAGYGDAYGYSNHITCEPGMLLCSVMMGEEEICKSDETFKGILLKQRRTIADRYSHCREISELYDLDSDYEKWRIGRVKEDVQVVEPKDVIHNRISKYPVYNRHTEFFLVEMGSVVEDGNKEIKTLSYEKEDILRVKERPSLICEKEKAISLKGSVNKTNHYYEVLSDINTNGVYLIFDAEEMYAGFKGIRIESKDNTTIDIIHADRLEKLGNVSARPSASTALRLNCKPGKYDFMSFEAYAGRYFKVVVRSKGKVRISSPYMVDYVYPDEQQSSFLSSDENLNRLYKSARKTLQLNTLDMFMDCPDRERGGWLCDSFWMGRAQKMLFGDTDVEKAMLLNFLQCPEERFDDGMGPAVYPGISKGTKMGGKINTWCLWQILEVYEYVGRSGDSNMTTLYEKHIYRLLEGLWHYKNDDGLLENVGEWTFIDWSASNHELYNKPVSVAVNSLYARVLVESGKIYNVNEWIQRGENIFNLIKKLAVGNLIQDALEKNEEGSWKGKDLYSEGGNYTVLWSGVLDNEEYNNLYERILLGCGPYKDESYDTLLLAPANMFIAYCIRYDLLSKNGYFSLMVKELLYSMSKMLKEGPGTLWETFSGSSSRCHGFMSHIGYLLMKDVLGIQKIDEMDKRITIVPHPCHLRFAKGTVSTNAGLLSVSWRIEKKNLILNVHAPSEYHVEIQDNVVDGNNIYNVICQ